MQQEIADSPLKPGASSSRGSAPDTGCSPHLYVYQWQGSEVSNGRCSSPNHLVHVQGQVLRPEWSAHALLSRHCGRCQLLPCRQEVANATSTAQCAVEVSCEERVPAAVPTHFSASAASWRTQSFRPSAPHSTQKADSSVTPGSSLPAAVSRPPPAREGARRIGLLVHEPSRLCCCRCLLC